MVPARPGLTRTVVALIAGLMILGSIGGYYFLSGGSTQTESSSLLTTSSNTAQNSIGTSGTPSGGWRAIVSLAASSPLASTDVVANYSVNVGVIGNAPNFLSLAVFAPAGIDVLFFPSQASTDPNAPKSYVSIKVDTGVVPGVYAFNITATGGGQTFMFPEQIQVVKYLVVTIETRYLPQNLSVPVGSVVYWMRLNGELGEEDPGSHNVSFRNSNVISPTLSQYQSWSYVFSAAGTFGYYCTFHPFMTGVIVVT